MTLTGKGDGQFSEPSVVFRFQEIDSASNRVNDLKHLRVADLNADGQDDLVAIDETSSSIIVVLGQGQGRFARPLGKS